MMKGDTALLWEKSFDNEIVHLAQGIKSRNIEGTNRIEFISKSEVPRNKRDTYGRIVVDDRPQKDERHRTCLTVRGDQVQYEGAVSALTDELPTIKMLFNSVVSTPKAKFMTCDVTTVYLNTLLPHFAYMQLSLKLIPIEITR